MEVYPCPICERKQSRGGVPFYDPTQTMSHIDGAHDGPHKDERGADYEEQVREGREDIEDEEVLSDTHGEDGGGGGSLPTISTETGGEMEMKHAVEMHDHMLNHPPDTPFAASEDVSTLIQQNAQLRQQNEDLRASVEELYEAVDLMAERMGAGLSWEERDVYDPVGEFES